ncbi:MAG: hypothetical protein ACK2UW_14055, partial [Anaerolineales bacterium]
GWASTVQISISKYSGVHLALGAWSLAADLLIIATCLENSYNQARTAKRPAFAHSFRKEAAHV